MQVGSNSTDFLRKRKFYLFLPLLALPFITLLYWAIAIKIIFKGQITQSLPKGMNTDLPDPNLKQKAVTKFDFYQITQLDSAKKIEQLKKDPYRQSELALLSKTSDSSAMRNLSAPFATKIKVNPVLYQGNTYSETSQIQVIKKLNKLDSLLAKSAQPKFNTVKKSRQTGQRDLHTTETAEPEISKIQAMLSETKTTELREESDPELDELNQMLDKIMDIQHPERVAEKTRKQNNKNRPQGLQVSLASEQSPVTILDAITSDATQMDPVKNFNATNSFFSLDVDISASSANAITAVIHENQTVVSGATVKLRLTSDIYISGQLIPKNTLIFGTVSLEAERLHIEIESLRHQNSLLTVNMSVYDLDGLPGIYIPGAISREVAKRSLSQDLQSLSLGSIDASLAGQAASAGVQTAKTFLGRKARLLQVTLKAGYQILLKDGSLKSI